MANEYACVASLLDCITMVVLNNNVIGRLALFLRLFLAKGQRTEVRGFDRSKDQNVRTIKLNIE